MFTKEELVLMHKALSELTIRGADSHAVSHTLNKIAELHQKPPVTNKNIHEVAKVQNQKTKK